MKNFRIAVVGIIVLIFSLTPAAVLADDISPANGYNDHDEAKMMAFLAQDSSVSGQTNAEVLSYDPSDPATWTDVEWVDVSGEFCLLAFRIHSQPVAGPLDLSGCTSLQVISG